MEFLWAVIVSAAGSTSDCGVFNWSPLEHLSMRGNSRFSSSWTTFYSQWHHILQYWERCLSTKNLPRKAILTSLSGEDLQLQLFTSHWVVKNMFTCSTSTITNIVWAMCGCLWAPYDSEISHRCYTASRDEWPHRVLLPLDCMMYKNLNLMISPLMKLCYGTHSICD